MTLVRGVMIPTAQIKEIEKEVGCKAVIDVDEMSMRLIAALDYALEQYMAQYKKYPKAINIIEDSTHYYRPMPMNINLGGYTAEVSNKPLWFRFPKYFTVN